jgi:uroporphyrinogen decarboxylase
LRAHIAAGAQAVQLFDSWAGSLSPNDYSEFVMPVISRIFRELADLPQPKIYFPGVSSGELLPLLRELDAQVIGLDWRVSIRDARARLGSGFAVQGNLDPYVLTAPMNVIRKHAKRIIDEGVERNGFIFNLGHGLFPEASIDKVKELTEYVHEYSRSALADRREVAL